MSLGSEYAFAGSGSQIDALRERDACGVGFVASVREPSRRVVDLALEALGRLGHRGAVAADGLTSDGTGILAAMPHEFFHLKYRELGGNADKDTEFGVAMCFLPRVSAEREHWKSALEAAMQAEHLPKGLWRRVPVVPGVLGPLASASAPHVWQYLVPRPAGIRPATFDQGLWRARRRLERQLTDDAAYIASFSCRSVVYKGLIAPRDLCRFYPDLAAEEFTAQAVLFHQRFSTNTTSSWSRAQPFRLLGHNGEINTIAGNVQWLEARYPGLVDRTTSDSGMLDNALEFVSLDPLAKRQGDGTPLPAAHTLLTLLRAAGGGDGALDPKREAYLRYAACRTEPWDGPAAISFCDGELVGAILDRNGLRPMRYAICDDGLVIAGSEAGIHDIPPRHVRRYGRLGPGDILVLDLAQGRILESDECKAEVAAAKPYDTWLDRGFRRLKDLGTPAHVPEGPMGELLEQLETAFGHGAEELAAVIRPMVQDGHPPVGSMGDDTPLAVLSRMERPLFHYFKQRFAQVTNPPIDHLREARIFSLESLLGPRGDLVQETPEHALLLALDSPILLGPELAAVRQYGVRNPLMRSETLPAVFSRAESADGLAAALDRLTAAAEAAVDGGAGILILSDRTVSEDLVPMPALLAVAAVHSRLVRSGRRMRCSVVAELGEPREVHHVATLLGYGANAVHPWIALARISELAVLGRLRGLGRDEALAAYRRSLEEGLRKVMARMGISTVDGYVGAQIFEAVGVGQEVIEGCFQGTPSRVSGLGFKDIGHLMFGWHQRAFPALSGKPPLHGFYKHRSDGELHLFSPEVVAAVQGLAAGPLAAPGSAAARERAAALAYAFQAEPPMQLHHLLDLQSDRPPVPQSEVEEASSIVRRFSSGSMSLGSLSPEAHEALAIGMNRLGARSGSGEGGEDPARNGTERESAIRQVASGRFGVTPGYLAHARELQIKMAQGSKPGEGGQIPGPKVTELVARLRHTTPGVPLISPPPHHDIYSIEDLAQLIHDLRQVNPEAEISVKLVAESGVGVISCGVAKAGADIIVLSGHAGGTGSSPLDSIKNAGLPWEIGLSEAQQELVANGLRARVSLRVDGGLRNGQDVVRAALLGADEFSFGTAAMIAAGCKMMRICHTDNCPVGVATQKESLRRKYPGTPEGVMNYFLALGEEVRAILADLGYHRLEDLIGRSDLLRQRSSDSSPRLDLGAILARDTAPDKPRRHESRIPVPEAAPLDRALLAGAAALLGGGRGPVELRLPIQTADRTVGARLFGAIASVHGDQGLAEGSLLVHFHGTAGQSFGAFMTPGVRFVLTGMANDHVGKGMAGGEIVLRPDSTLRGSSHEHVLLGNTALYGATGGVLLAAGRAGERFAVRNSGALAVVEGVGEHGCEYMTCGTVVVLGEAGYNFGAGMTGGEAFLLDEYGRMADRINPDVGEPREVAGPDEERLLALLEQFLAATSSAKAREILRHWAIWRPRFLHLAPHTAGLAQEEPEEGSIA